MFRVETFALEVGRLIRFGVTGLAATAVYAVVSLVSIEVSRFSLVAGSVLGVGASTGVSFYGHTRYSFKVELDHDSPLRRFLILAALSFALSTGLMWLLVYVIGVSPRIAVVTICIVI